MESNVKHISGDDAARSCNLVALIVLAFAPAFGAGVGYADQAIAPTSGLEEIVVTAEKRSESLQNVPLSVATLSSDELDRRGISSVASLMMGDVPSVRVQPYAGNPTVVSVGMRGFLDPNGFDITNENPVPAYIDDVYYGRQNSLALELNDLDRIEVLRGPQGTLFGKNAEGGALRMVSKEPTGDFDLNAKFDAGNFGYKKGIVHIDMPSVAGVAAKIDLLATDSNGWTTNPAPGQHNYGVVESGAGKLTLLWKASDSFKIEYAGDYTSMKSTEDWNAQISYSPIGSPYNSAWPNQTTTPLSEPYATYRPLDQQVYWGQRITADWGITDSINLNSISALRSDKATIYNTAATSSVIPGPFFLPAGACPGPIPFCSGAITDPVIEYFESHRQFSQEIQLTGRADQLDWVAGLFYIKETGSQNQLTYLGAFLPNSIPPAFPYLPVTPSTSAIISPLFGPVGTAGAQVLASSKAAFGQVTYRPPVFDDKLSFTGGVRVGRDDKSAVRPANGGEVFSTATYPAFPNGPILGGLPCPQSPRCSPSFAKTETSPLASVAYAWTTDLSTYFRYSTGYQAAGLSVGSQTFKFVSPSTVDAFELGLKSEFAEHTVRVNVAAFYENWKDPQEDVQTTASSTVEFFSGPTIHISGLELDTTYAPLPGLTVNGSLSLLHGKQATTVNPYAPPPGFPPTSAEFHLVALPGWAASVAVQDDILRTDYGIWRFNVQTNGTASYYTVPNLSRPIASYWVVNARFGLAEIPLGSNGGKLEVSAWANNLFNRSFNTFIYEVQGPNTDGSFGPPRMWGGSLAYRFK